MTIRLQAKYQIEEVYPDNHEEKIDDILDAVDGKPKKSFAQKILETTYEDLLKESDNSEMEYDGTTFTMPNLETSDESTIYDFLRNLALSRNGLWSDEDYITNLVAIRREMVTSSTEDTGFNDTLLLSWKENNEKKVVQYIATTEPGKLNTANGKLLPQTTTLFLWLHKFGNYKVQIPALRTINIYRKKQGSQEHVFSNSDDGINIHQAPIAGRVPKGLPTSQTSYGIHTNFGNTGYTEQELEAYLTAVRVYRILSDWGAGRVDSSISCYHNLENHTKTFTLSEIIGTTDTTREVEIKEGENIKKTLKLSDYQTYIATNYATTKTKSNAIKLLMYHHNDQNDGTLESSYNDTELTDIIKELKEPDVFRSIVKLQMDEQLDLAKIDAKPGKGTLAKINRTEAQKTDDSAAFSELIQKAQNDWSTLTDLFVTWDSNSKLPTTLKSDLQTKLKMSEDARKGKTITEIDSHGGLELEGEVGNWSTACQVISGTQKFFHFMYDITRFVSDTAQERWYYTIVESSTLGIALN